MKWILMAFLILAHPILFGQVFKGKALKKHLRRSYCELKIFKDSSIYLICHDSGNYDKYEEYYGTIKKNNDSILRITTTTCFSKVSFMGREDGTILIVFRTGIHPDKLRISYHDGFNESHSLDTILKRETDYRANESGKNPFYFAGNLVLNRHHFHYKEELDTVMGMINRKYISPIGIDIGHINPITNKHVIFGSYDSGSAFYSGETKMDIDLLVTENQLLLNWNKDYIEMPKIYLSKMKE